jgi:hypothetical protein
MASVATRSMSFRRQLGTGYASIFFLFIFFCCGHRLAGQSCGLLVQRGWFLLVGVKGNCEEKEVFRGIREGVFFSSQLKEYVPSLLVIFLFRNSFSSLSLPFIWYCRRMVDDLVRAWGVFLSRVLVSYPAMRRVKGCLRIGDKDDLVQVVQDRRFVGRKYPGSKWHNHSALSILDVPIISGKGVARNQEIGDTAELFWSDGFVRCTMILFCLASRVEKDCLFSRDLALGGWEGGCRLRSFLFADLTSLHSSLRIMYLGFDHDLWHLGNTMASSLQMEGAGMISREMGEACENGTCYN